LDVYGIIVLLSLSFLLGGFVKGATGYGMPLVATPILLISFTLPQVVLIMVPAIFFSNLVQGFQTRQCWRVLKIFWPMVAANCLILLFFGGRILTMVDAKLLTLFVGVMMVVHAGLSLAPPIGAVERVTSAISIRKIILPSGILSGLLGSITTIYGFPSLQVIVAAKCSKEECAFLFSIFLASGHLALWRGMVLNNYSDPVMLQWGLVGCVPMFFALLAGRIVHKKLSVEGFRKAINLVLLLAGLGLVLKSL
jgi:uncharacterized membrane protein YfcA